MSTTSTGIEWADATWNPVRGCSRVSEGCRNCYAETMAARFCGEGQPFEGFAERTNHGPHWTGQVELVQSALSWPLSRRKWAGRFAVEHGRRPRVFVNSMSDLFHERLSDEAIAAVFGVMAAAPWIDFLILTKRPERMRAWFEWVDQRKHLHSTLSPLTERQQQMPVPWPLSNAWLGVSVEDEPTAKRIWDLRATPAAKRFVSYEPALGEVDFAPFLVQQGMPGKCFDIDGDYWHEPGECKFCQRTLDWLIVGGESGPGARPCDVEWIRSAVRQCQSAGVPVFVKQLGAAPVEEGCAPGHVFIGRNPAYLSRIKHSKGGDMSEWPEDLRVREVPR